MPTRVSDRDLGRMAESRLEDWAAQVNITANKSTNDREGWDYFLQFPHPSVESDTTMDRRDARIECLIQVKGTTEKQVRKSIKLSNWAKLAESPFPAFFLIVVYSNGYDPVSAYLAHIGEEHINRALERLRQLRGADENSLNRRRMVVRWNDSNALPSLDGPGLQKVIERYIPNGMDDYINWKLDTRESAGSPVPHLLHWTKQFDSNDEAWQEIVDLAIGITDSISVPNMTHKEDVRFGIPSKITELGEGTLDITSRSSIECRLDIHYEDSPTGSTFPAQFFNTRMFLGNIEIPSRFNRWRIAFELGELVVEVGTGKGILSLSFPAYNQEYLLEQLYNIWRLVDVFAKGRNVPISITAFSESEEHLVQAQLILDDDSLAIVELIQNWEVVQKTRWLSRALDLPQESQVSLAQLLVQQETINLLRSVFDPRETDISFSSDVLEKFVDEILKKELAFPIIRQLRFGETLNLVSFAIAGQPARIGEPDSGRQRIELVSPRLILLEHERYPLDTVISPEPILDNLKERLESDGYNVLIF